MTFLSRTTPKTTDFLHAEEIISNNLIPALTNRDCPDQITRRVLSLSLHVRNSGLAINQPDDYSRNYSDSQNHSAPLDASFDLIILEQDRTKKEIHKERLKTATQKQNQIIGATNPDLLYALKLAREKGASWLNALPIENHGLWLTKLEFRYALWIRYGWDFKNMPSPCACGSPFVLFHALHCPQRRIPDYQAECKT